jgi:hypothetical protein
MILTLAELGITRPGRVDRGVMFKWTAVLAVLCSILAVACTKHVDGCDANSDCTDPAYPFCDVDGQYAPSGGNKNVCTIIPPDCPANVCGCSPGAATCATDQLTTCNADGMSTSTTGCALGCSDDEITCKSFMPSNNLGPSLIEAAAEPDVTIVSGSTIDTDTGAVVMPNGTPIIVASALVPQSSGMIRAFTAHSFTIADVSVTGSYPIALVAADDMTLNGILDASANGSAAGPGAQAPGTGCDGGSIGAAVIKVLCGVFPAPGVLCGPGPGGGGNAVSGGAGGNNGIVLTANYGSVSGGAATTGFSPLVGGCSGGIFEDMQDTIVAPAGGAGGAVQLVSGGTMELIGIVHVGGGGGTGLTNGAAGGGAGGNIVIETPTLTIGTAGGFAANGGGAGGCGVDGVDGSPDNVAAAGGTSTDASCSGTNYLFAGGAGGTSVQAPGSGGFDTRTPVMASDFFGGGGGSVGRIRIATLDGTFSSMPSSLVSAVVTTDTLVTQ